MDIGYVAGFFDGEGCVTLLNRSGKRPPRVKIIIHQRDPEPLYAIQAFLGFGRVRSVKGQRREPIHLLAFEDSADVYRFVKLVAPLSHLNHRREKLLLAGKLANAIQKGRSKAHREKLRQEWIDTFGYAYKGMEARFGNN